MRKSILILLLGGLVTLATAADAFAQRRGGGFNGRGGGVYIGTPIGSVGVGQHGGVYINAGYGIGGYGYGHPFNSGYGYGGYPSYSTYGYSSGYSDPYYYGQSYYVPSYSYPAYSSGTPNTATMSYYQGQNGQQSASLTVLLPMPDAQIWVGDTAINGGGVQRQFQSPPLDKGNYTYTLKARWMQNGQPVDQERTVNIQAGQNVTVDFRTPNNPPNQQKAPEPIPDPNTPKK